MGGTFNVNLAGTYMTKEVEILPGEASTVLA
jgi:hypothetical protein